MIIGSCTTEACESGQDWKVAAVSSFLLCVTSFPDLSQLTVTLVDSDSIVGAHKCKASLFLERLFCCEIDLFIVDLEMTKLLNSLVIFILLLLVGCGFSVPDFEAVYDAELPGNKYIARNFNIQLA